MVRLRYVGPSRKDLSSLGIKRGTMVIVPEWMVIDNTVVIHTLFDPVIVPLSHFSDDESSTVDLGKYMDSLTRQFD